MNMGRQQQMAPRATQRDVRMQDYYDETIEKIHQSVKITLRT